MAYQETVADFSALTGQKVIWERLSKIATSGEIGNAYLFTGPSGSGKEALALAFGQHLNCEISNTNSAPCVSCPSCQRFKQLQHEKLKLIFPLPVPKKTIGNELEKKTLKIVEDEIKKKAKDPFYKIQIPKSNRILIQSIRDLRKTIYLKASGVGRKIVLFFDSHLLSVGQGESANALLKILEEPPENTTLLLVSDHKTLVLPTILSRCQHIGIPRLNDDFIASWFLKNGLNSDDVNCMTGLSLGNIHQARLLVKQPLSELIILLDTLVNTLTNDNPDKWRLFIQKYTKMANQDPKAFKFHFRMISLWFCSAFRLRKNMPDLFYKTELRNGLETFITRYPNADLFKISIFIEEMNNELGQNLYMPLVLTNLILDIQKALHS